MKEIAMILEVNDDTPPTLATGAWLYAACENPWYPENTDRSGKWLVFLSNQSIDRYWQLIRLSLAMYRLGDEVKVTTGIRPPGKDHVICIYTYDYADYQDILRIRKELYEIGIRRPISYKSNEQTRLGQYGRDWPIKSEAGKFVSIYRI